MITHRDLHPNDIILIYGDIKKIERVDRTHIATRNGSNGTLELWGYGEQLEFIKFNDKLYLKDLGFIEDNEDTLILYTDRYTIRWTLNSCLLIDKIDNFRISKFCETLNEVQQFFYKQTCKELSLKYD